MERSQQAAASVANVPQVITTPPETVEVASAPEVIQTPGGGGGVTVQVTNSPTIVVNGDAPDDLDAKLEENNRRLVQEFEESLRRKEDDERRSDYE